MSKDDVKLKRKERESELKEHKKEKREKKEKKERKNKKEEKNKELVVEAESETKEPSMPKQVESGVSAAVARDFMESNNITIEMAEESSEKPPRPMLSFHELQGKIDAKLKERLDMEGFEKPTLIQSCCWPVLLQGRDMVGVAETGSGKTLAFGIPALQYVIRQSPSKKSKAKIQVLVIAPTRELAIQTRDNLARVAEPLGYGVFCLYGGVSKGEQLRQMREYALPVHIVVGTPGRVLDLAREGSLDLSRVSYLTLDEADRMLDKGFEPDIRAIIGMTRSHEEGRHTNMFSATWPPAVRGLAETFMRLPVRVTVGSDVLSANRRVSQPGFMPFGLTPSNRLHSFLKHTIDENPYRSCAVQMLEYPHTMAKSSYVRGASTKRSDEPCCW